MQGKRCVIYEGKHTYTLRQIRVYTQVNGFIYTSGKHFCLINFLASDPYCRVCNSGRNV